MADIIDMTKLREAEAAANATARLHEVLCMAAEATATGALNTEGRLVLAAAVPRAALGTQRVALIAEIAEGPRLLGPWLAY